MSLAGAAASREMKWDEGVHQGHGLVGDTGSRVMVRQDDPESILQP